MELMQVILVDVNDRQTGTMEKMEAHEKGLLHRAFSVFIFNAKGEMLLQQRAMSKYHSGGLWTNACCSHPLPNEETPLAAKRRLQEELGFETSIEKVFDFVYKADFDNGLTEYEFDHVFVGEYEGVMNFNKEEVMDYCYKAVQEIRQGLKNNPQKYTPWFHLAFPKIENWWCKRYKNEPDSYRV
ncbi:MAG: isopentenyl-diphosphate Delta-isomerase, partial [Chitinophagaceae bacterium]|nr:isopentenyl-diphosphate Delta-isomerase [Chitinophagaceae bacterium]